MREETDEIEKRRSQKKISSLANCAQQSVHWTGGIRRKYQAFSGFGFFLLPSRVRARPPAGNAGRWAASFVSFLENVIAP